MYINDSRLNQSLLEVAADEIDFPESEARKCCGGGCGGGCCGGGCGGGCCGGMGYPFFMPPMPPMYNYPCMMPFSPCAMPYGSGYPMNFYPPMGYRVDYDFPAMDDDDDEDQDEMVVNPYYYHKPSYHHHYHRPHYYPYFYPYYPYYPMKPYHSRDEYDED